MLFWCWSTVADGGPALKQHWLNAGQNQWPDPVRATCAVASHVSFTQRWPNPGAASYVSWDKFLLRNWTLWKWPQFIIGLDGLINCTLKKNEVLVLFSANSIFGQYYLEWHVLWDKPISYNAVRDDDIPLDNTVNVNMFISAVIELSGARGHNNQLFDLGDWVWGQRESYRRSPQKS